MVQGNCWLVKCQEFRLTNGHWNLWISSIQVSGAGYHQLLWIRLPEIAINVNCATEMFEAVSIFLHNDICFWLLVLYRSEAWYFGVKPCSVNVKFIKLFQSCMKLETLPKMEFNNFMGGFFTQYPASGFGMCRSIWGMIIGAFWEDRY